MYNLFIRSCQHRKDHLIARDGRSWQVAWFKALRLLSNYPSYLYFGDLFSLHEQSMFLLKDSENVDIAFVYTEKAFLISEISNFTTSGSPLSQPIFVATAFDTTTRGPSLQVLKRALLSETSF